MMRTNVHAPDRITILTFQADSPQHQLSIMTLVTHLLLSVSSITAQQSWNIVRDGETHQRTLQLVLATITLKRYHKGWFSFLDQPTSLPSILPPPKTRLLQTSRSFLLDSNPLSDSDTYNLTIR